MIDRFTKHVVAVPTNCISAEACVKILFEHWVAKFGCPEVILLCRGHNIIEDNNIINNNINSMRCGAATAQKAWKTGPRKSSRAGCTPMTFHLLTTLACVTIKHKRGQRESISVMAKTTTTQEGRRKSARFCRYIQSDNGTVTGISHRSISQS